MRITFLAALLFKVCLSSYAQLPTVTSFKPTSAATGTNDTITGTNFTSATSVTFGGTPAASFIVVSATQIIAVVAGGTSGSVVVTNPSGTGTRAGFYYLPLSAVITDFGGYWNSSTAANNPARPDSSHNLLAFNYNGTTYSTGANNAILNTKGVSYTPGNFRSLPVAGITGNNPGGSVYLALAKKVDGSAAVANQANVSNFSVKSVLSDGLHGLDLGTGFTNLPASANLSFNIFNINSSTIADPEPDILITQVAQPVTGNDIFSFVDATGTIVGNAITQDMTKLVPFGWYDLDLFNLTPAASFNTATAYSAFATNTNREIRLVGFKLADFGITSGNVSQVKALKISPSSTSDYAFIAYNANAINLPPNISQNDALTNNNICSGGIANLAVIAAAASGGVLTYQWERSTNAGSSWVPVTNGGIFSNATSNRLSVAGATNADQYRATVTESTSGYANTSAVFFINVVAAVPVTSVSISGSANPCLNEPVILNSTVSGGGSSLFYQWQSGLTSGGTFTDIPGAILNSYLPPVTSTGATYYQLRVSSGSGCSGGMNASAPASITVTGISSVTPATRCGSGIVSLSATATSGSIDWHAADAGGTSLVTSNSYSPAISATTTYYITSSGCSGALRVPVVATVDPASVGGSVAGGTSVCSGTNTTTFTLGGHTGAVVKWQSSTDNFSSIIIDIANTTTSITVTDISVTTQYRAVVKSGVCGNINSNAATLTVTSPPTATISYNGPYCLNEGSASVTFSGAAGGAYSAAAGLAINSATGSITLNTSTPGNYLVTYAIAASGGCNAYNTTANVTINGTEGLWNGLQSTDWNNPANWCSNTIPVSTTNVLIPSGVVNMPSVSANVVIHDLEIQGDRKLTISGYSFTLNGAVSGTGTFTTSANSSLIIGGTSGGATGILNFTAGSNVLGSLTINRTGSNASASVGSPVVVSNVLTLTAGQLNTSNLVTLASAVSGTARLAPVATGASINGNVTVERYIQEKRAWRLLSVPVSGTQTLNAAWQEGATSSSQNPVPGYGTHLTGGNGNGFDQTQTNSAGIRIFDQSTMSFTATPLSSTLLPVNNQPGYFLYVRGDRSINLYQTGTLSNTSTTLRTNGALKTGPQNFVTQPGFCTLIGNPYASAVDFALLSRTNVPGRFYLWDPKLNLVGGYQTFDESLGYVPVPGGGSYGPPAVGNSIIQSGQAFLVQGSGGVGSILFDESAKASGSSNSGFRETSIAQKLFIRLNSVAADQSLTLTDAALAVFDAGYSSAVDNEDARKMTNVDEMFTLQRESKSLSIERRPLLNVNDTLFIKAYNLKQKNYQLALEPVNIDAPGLAAFVEDTYLNTITPVSLSTGTVLPFTVSADPLSGSSGRFRILFRPAGVLPVKFTTVKAVKKPGYVEVSWKVATETNLLKYKVEKSYDGVLFTDFTSADAKTNNHAGASYSVTDAALMHGQVYYRIKVIEISGVFYYSDIVRLNLTEKGTKLMVYPNPFSTGKLTYEIANLAAGTYQLRLYNYAGQLIHQKQINHSAGDLKEQLVPGLNLLKGEYRLVISNDKVSYSQTITRH